MKRLAENHKKPMAAIVKTAVATPARKEPIPDNVCVTLIAVPAMAVNTHPESNMPLASKATGTFTARHRRQTISASGTQVWQYRQEVPG